MKNLGSIYVVGALNKKSQYQFLQKQPFTVVLPKYCSAKYHKIRKKYLCRSLFSIKFFYNSGFVSKWIDLLKNHSNKIFQFYLFFSISNKTTSSNICILFSLTIATPFQKTLRISIDTFHCTRETKTGTFNRNWKFFMHIFKETSKFSEWRPSKNLANLVDFLKKERQQV